MTKNLDVNPKGTMTGICPNCVKTGRGAECSFMVVKVGKKTTYTCESCGKEYTKKPRVK